MIKTTFLLFPLSCSLGNTLRVTNVTVVQWPTLSNPVHPGVSATLQCSVLSDSEDKKCPGEHSVHWFGVRSDKSYPNIIYTDGNEQNECKKTSDTKKSCVYHLSKNFSSSDAGIYYCAVATCGEILFGDGTKLNIEDGLMSVTIVQLGESATFTCVYPDWEHSNTRVKWYKQSVGDSLTLITTLLKGTETPAFEKGFPHYRFNTIQEDKAMYHCAVTTWSKDEWTSTYLSLEDKTDAFGFIIIDNFNI
ncbi:hypothetical protein F7725_010474 [Dissostichus mawsoni]|uniref:Ig-like domain-containing protein n=1 Tax=Dissostichus mawsoni TaxID=36200 RepID=A0A7J5XNK0_DISMA|nr:hypothetical protein F7725_010474 [Dissostichus mawsoni]